MMRTSALFHSSRRVKLALVPVVALGVVAFATPAHADDTIVVPPVELNDVSSVRDLVLEQAPVVAPFTEPTGDGSVPAAVTANETPASVPPDSTETAANNVVAAETEPTPAATETAPAEAIPPADVEPQRTATAPSSEPQTTQYHPAPPQYQPTRAAVDHAPRIQRETPRKTVRPKPRDATARASRHAAKLVQIMARICADIDLGNLIIPVENVLANSDWNDFQIGGCIVDPTSPEVPLGGVAAPSACPPDGQYQLPGEQYQIVDCALPAAPPIASPGSSAGGPELGASIPSFPASPISPPVVEAVVPAAPAVQNSKPPKARPVRAAGPPRTNHVLDVSPALPVPPSNPVLRPARRVRHVKKEHATPSVRHTEIRGPTARAQALDLRPQRTASGAPSASSTSPWLVAAGLLLVFGLASLASAIMEGAGAVSPTLLKDLRVHATSRGLSKHSLGTKSRRPQGIRYRD